MIEIRIPSNYIFTYNCRKLLISHLTDYIIYNNERYVEEDFIIYIHDTYLKIKYKHHYYNVTILIKNNLYYYYLSPFNKDFFTILAQTPDTFELVLLAIKEHDKLKYKTKES